MRFLVTAAAMLAAMSFIGCGDKEEDTAAEEAEEQAEEAAEEETGEAEEGDSGAEETE